MAQPGATGRHAGLPPVHGTRVPRRHRPVPWAGAAPVPEADGRLARVGRVGRLRRCRGRTRPGSAVREEAAAGRTWRGARLRVRRAAGRHRQRRDRHHPGRTAAQGGGQSGPPVEPGRHRRVRPGLGAGPLRPFPVAGRPPSGRGEQLGDVPHRRAAPVGRPARRRGGRLPPADRPRHLPVPSRADCRHAASLSRHALAQPPSHRARAALRGHAGGVRQAARNALAVRPRPRAGVLRR